MCLTIEAAVRHTVPGSVLHATAATKLLELAADRSSDDGGGAPGSAAGGDVEHAAAARLARLALCARYGELGSLFRPAVAAYLESDATRW
jgi:hypothetical protein